MHDSAHFGVNEARLYTVPPSVVRPVDRLDNDPGSASILPEWGRNSGRGVKMTDLGNTGSWCEPRAIPCEPYSRKHSPAARIEQRTRVALAGSMGLSRTLPRTPARTTGHKSTTLVTTCDPHAVG